ncbi:MAG: aldo/keto reductase [Betaproteobacteria bacterium]|nr:MAG: aldo/keto reductase [Betaproteobacteria bacterium]
MKRRKLGALEVPAIGLGCMVMPGFYFPGSEEQSIATLHRAAAIGVNFIDTADAYGNGRNEELVARAIKGRRGDYIIATKFGNVWRPDADYGVDGRPEYVAAACEASLKRLGIETIDLYYQHRVDPKVPIEETVGAMARLVEQGKVRHLGLSEASAQTLRRAHAVHPIAALQTEYSLWTRDAELEILPLCRELGIGYVAYSPLGRGIFGGAIAGPESLAEGDRRRAHPRFQADNLRANVALVEPVKRIAAAHGCTPAQVALAWLLAKSDDIVPIPGTRRIDHLEANAAAADLALTATDVAALDAACPPGAAQGPRYPASAMAKLNG